MLKKLVFISFLLLAFSQFSYASDADYCPPNTTYTGSVTVTDPKTGSKIKYVNCSYSSGSSIKVRMIGGGSLGGGGTGGGGGGSPSGGTEYTGESTCSNGNPIDLATQNKIQTEFDFVGRGKLPLTIKRSYNSLGSGVDLFGSKWSSNLAPSLSVRRARVPANPIVSVSLHRADGQLRRLKYHSENNTWSRLGRLAQFSVLSNNEWLYIDRGIQEYYYPNGKIKSILHPSGETLNYMYQYSKGEGKLLTIEHNSGESLDFSYSSGSRVSEIKYPGDHTIKYTYLNSLLATVEYPSDDGSSQKRQYNYSGYNLTSIIDENGDKFASWEYSLGGKANRSYHGNAQENFQILSTVDNSSGSRVVKTQNSLGKQTSYHFNNIANKWKITKVEGHAAGTCSSANLSTTYDEEGFKDLVTDWSGNVTDYDFDVLGYLVHKKEATGTSIEKVTKYSWDQISEQILYLETDALLTEYSYYADNLLKEIKESERVGELRARKWVYSYTKHSNGLVKTKFVDGPRTDVGDIDKYYYDSKGNLVKHINPVGHITVYSGHNGFGEPTSVTLPDGLTKVFYTYNPRGWLTKIEQGANFEKRILRYTYDKIGQVKKVTSPSGIELEFSYDSAHRLTNIKNGKSESIKYAYDNASNITSKKITHIVRKFSMCGSMWEPDICFLEVEETLKDDKKIYDALSRLKEVISNGRTEAKYSYNLSNEVSKEIDGKSEDSTNDYDELGRVKKITNRSGGVTEVFYNSDDKIIRIKDPKGLTTHYKYDGFKNLIEINSPDSGITSFKYDLEGNLVQKDDARGVRINFVYDANNRVISDSAGHSYQYDKQPLSYDVFRKGFLNQVTDKVGISNYKRNSHGELEHRTETIDGLIFNTSWDYSLDGSLKEIKHPNGMKIEYVYDVLGNVSAVKVNNSYFISSIKYKPFGPISSITYTGNKTTYLQRDKSYRLDKISTAGLLDLDFQYDANSNITRVDDNYSSSTSKYKQYSYDVLERLLTSKDYGTTKNYSYDDNGNRLTDGSISSTIDSSSNKLLNSAGIGFFYDENGNIVRSGNHYYSYNDNNRLEHYTNGSISAQYRYNYLNQRKTKNVNGVKTYYVYDLDGKLIYERSGVSKKNYIYLNNKIVGYAINNTLYFVHSDHLSRPQVITDTSSAVVWKSKNNAFGRTITEDTIGGFNIGFPGQYWDAEKGSWYNGYRDYEPGLGRYLQSDPLGLYDGPNTYGYAHQNPVNKVDFDGRAVCGGLCVVGIGVGTIRVGQWLYRAAFAGSATGVAYLGNEALQNQAEAESGAQPENSEGEECDSGSESGEGVFGQSGGNKGKKGKEKRPGKKKDRDNWYGQNDKKFQKWWERAGKDDFNDGFDLEDSGNASDAYDYWVEMGKPRR